MSRLGAPEEYNLSDDDASALAANAARSPKLAKLLVNPLFGLAVIILGLVVPRLYRRWQERRKNSAKVLNVKP